MSRGLGRLQLAILAALEPAKQTHLSGELDYIGGATNHNSDEDGMAKARGKKFTPEVYSRGYFVLDPGVYDLRATLSYLARTWPNAGVGGLNRSGYKKIDSAFRNHFGEAVRGLIARGKLFESHKFKKASEQLRFVCTDPIISGDKRKSPVRTLPPLKKQSPGEVPGLDPSTA